MGLGEYNQFLFPANLCRCIDREMGNNGKGRGF